MYSQPSGESAKNGCDQRDVGKIGPEQIQERSKWQKALAGGNQRHRPWRDSTKHPTPPGRAEHGDHWPLPPMHLPTVMSIWLAVCRTGQIYLYVCLWDVNKKLVKQKYPVSFPAYLSYSQWWDWYILHIISIGRFMFLGPFLVLP